jgi:hypothetical protein
MNHCLDFSPGSGSFKSSIRIRMAMRFCKDSEGGSVGEVEFMEIMFDFVTGGEDNLARPPSVLSTFLCSPNVSHCS